MPPFVPDLKLILVTLAAAALPFVAIWLVSLKVKDASIVDVYWGPGFIVVAGAALAISAPTAGALSLFIATALWGLRLGLHLGIRKGAEPGEDGRYQAMRRTWKGSFAWQSLVWVFLLQAVLQWIVAVPVWMGIAYAQPPLGWLLALGGAIFAAGLIVESIADWQLTRFKARNKGTNAVCDVGLWSWSRHPNYFGETVIWWGIYLMALSVGAPWWTAIGPAVITFLLLRVSGVTLLEKGLKKRKPAYADYARRTSAFIPWPPKRP